jgi:hypothetical protein
MKKMIVGGLAAVAAALGIAAAVPAQVHADASTDAVFIAGERAGGITGPMSTLIAYGHTVCYDIDVAGMRPADAQHQIWLQTDMDENQSIWFTIGAIDNYCPWDKNLMPGQTDATGSTVA